MTPYFSYVTQFADKYTTLYFNLCTSIYNNGKIITSIYYWSDSMIWVRGRKLLACWTKDWEKRENKKIIRRNMSLKRFILPDRQYWDGKTGLLSQALKHSKKLAELYDVSVNYLLEISENQAAPAPVESPDKSVHPAEKEKEEYQYEIFFFLILSILSVAVAPVGLLISIVSIIRARKKRIPKLFYLVVTICLLINIWNCIMIFQMFFLDIGYATISS